MKSKLLALCLLVLGLSSCSLLEGLFPKPPSINTTSNNYDDVIPSVAVEKAEEGEGIKALTLQEYQSKIENDESFIIFYHLTDCSACHSAVNNYLNTYINVSKNRVYGIDAQPMGDAVYSQLVAVTDNSGQYKFRDYQTFPFLYIYQNGEVIVGESTYSSFTKMLYAYVYDNSGTDADSFPTMPYISVNQNTSGQLVDIYIDRYIERVENNESFVILYYLNSCPACDIAKNDFLIKYVVQREIEILQIEVSSNSMGNYDKERLFDLTRGSTFPYENNQVAPLLYLYHQGEVQVASYTYTNYFRLLDSYLLID